VQPGTRQHLSAEVSIRKCKAVLNLKEADGIEVVTLMDNTIDVLAPSFAGVQRAPHYQEGDMAPPLAAEHGLSVLIRVSGRGNTHTILLDAGWSEGAVLHNMKLLGIDVEAIEHIVLSHGHMDHHGGLLTILDSRRKPVPVLVHPGVFLEHRFLRLQDGKKVRFPLLDEQALVRAGAEITKTASPCLMASNLAVATGEIARTTAFEKGMPNAFYEKDNEIHRDPILDDQAVILHLKGKGLVVITGCSHAGIINTITYARELTGVPSVHAIIGGFHLSGPAFEPIIETTIAALKGFGPHLIAPMHCTGWKATTEIARQMPAQFVASSVGTTITLQGDN